MDDDPLAVAELIYLTDKYIYPAFCEGSLEKAKAVFPHMLDKECIYNHKNIQVALIDGKIAGYMALMEKYPKANYESFRQAFLEGIGRLSDKFEDVMVNYFNTLDFPFTGTQIVSLAVLPQYRKMRVGSAMLESLDPNKDYSLACVKDNVAGRRLYETHGFKLSFEYPGYIGIPCVELVKKGGEGK